MSRLKEVKLNCLRVLNDTLGLTTLTPYFDSIEVLDFEFVGEKQVLHTASFKVKHCDLIVYYVDFLNNDFIVRTISHEGELIVL